MLSLVVHVLPPERPLCLLQTLGVGISPCGKPISLDSIRLSFIGLLGNKSSFVQGNFQFCVHKSALGGNLVLLIPLFNVAAMLLLRIIER